MKRALGTLTPYETYEKAQRAREEKLLEEFA
jgi:alpha,alpha-trehalase